MKSANNIRVISRRVFLRARAQQRQIFFFKLRLEGSLQDIIQNYQLASKNLSLEKRIDFTFFILEEIQFFTKTCCWKTMVLDFQRPWLSNGPAKVKFNPSAPSTIIFGIRETLTYLTCLGPLTFS